MVRDLLLELGELDHDVVRDLLLELGDPCCFLSC